MFDFFGNGMGCECDVYDVIVVVIEDVLCMGLYICDFGGYVGMQEVGEVIVVWVVG